MEYTNIDNTELIKSDEWAGNRENIILEYEVNISARKCEWNYTDFDTVVKKRLNPERFAEDLKKMRLDAVDFKNWGKNKWHDPKTEVDAWNKVRNSIENEDIVIKSADFTEEDTFKDMQPYHERKVRIVYAVNVTRALERENELEIGR